jgi:hypothetical protein
VSGFLLEIIKRDTHYNINANKNNSRGWKKITQKDQIKKDNLKI